MRPVCDGRKDVLPVCIKAGALEDNVPKRDLWISPNHAMYLDGVLIEAKDLVNGGSIVQAESAESIEYYHVELDTHDVLIAEGALAESYIDDDNRLLFHNAHEYREKYPDQEIGPAQYYAPRCDSGYELETVRQRIALRAGLVAGDVAPPIGNLRGFVDRITSECVSGWAQYPITPKRRSASTSLPAACCSVRFWPAVIAKTSSRPAWAAATTASSSLCRRRLLLLPTKSKCCARSTVPRSN